MASSLLSLRFEPRAGAERRNAHAMTNKLPTLAGLSLSASLWACGGTEVAPEPMAFSAVVAEPGAPRPAGNDALGALEVERALDVSDLHHEVPVAPGFDPSVSVSVGSPPSNLSLRVPAEPSSVVIHVDGLPDGIASRPGVSPEPGRPNPPTVGAEDSLFVRLESLGHEQLARLLRETGLEDVLALADRPHTLLIPRAEVLAEIVSNHPSAPLRVILEQHILRGEYRPSALLLDSYGTLAPETSFRPRSDFELEGPDGVELAATGRSWKMGDHLTAVEVDTLLPPPSSLRARVEEAGFQRFAALLAVAPLEIVLADPARTVFVPTNDTVERWGIDAAWHFDEALRADLGEWIRSYVLDGPYTMSDILDGTSFSLDGHPLVVEWVVEDGFEQSYLIREGERWARLLSRGDALETDRGSLVIIDDRVEG